MSHIAGEVVLVTGASRGFGQAAARAFGRAGAQVIALARTTGALESLDESIRPGGGAATLVPLDLTDDPGLARMGAALYDRFGRVDLWLHTATYAPPQSPAAHVGEKELDSALAVNIRAFSRLLRVMDPLLRQSNRGRALLLTDPAAAEGRAFQGLYGATKAAQAALWRAWTAESAGRLTLAEIAPPPMPTALRGRFYPGEPKDGLTPADTAVAELMARLPALAHGDRIELATAPGSLDSPAET